MAQNKIKAEIANKTNLMHGLQDRSQREIRLTLNFCGQNVAECDKMCVSLNPNFSGNRKLDVQRCRLGICHDFVCRLAQYPLRYKALAAHKAFSVDNSDVQPVAADVDNFSMQWKFTGIPVDLGLPLLGSRFACWALSTRLLEQSSTACSSLSCQPKTTMSCPVFSLT